MTQVDWIPFSDMVQVVAFVLLPRQFNDMVQVDGGQFNGMVQVMALV